MLGDGYQVMKPCIGPRGEAESSFYRRVFDPRRKGAAPVPFLPHFFGVATKQEWTEADDETSGEEDGSLSSPARPRTPGTAGSSDATSPSSVSSSSSPSSSPPASPSSPGYVSYLVLEDLASRFARPSIMDVKIGVQTWDENASPSKIAAERSKYPPQATLGFRLTGMRVWDEGEGRFREHGRKYGYGLDEGNVHRAFEEFLHDGTRLRSEVIPPLLSRLRELEAYFATQNEFRFYGSSLLFLYEGDPKGAAAAPTGSGALLLTPGSMPPAGSRTESGAVRGAPSTPIVHTSLAPPAPRMDVRMIDFAHVWPIRDGPEGRDDGYLKGLRNVIHCLELVEARAKEAEKEKEMEQGSTADVAARSPTSHGSASMSPLALAAQSLRGTAMRAGDAVQIGSHPTSSSLASTSFQAPGA
jgi:hypothetical protein